MKPKKLLSFLLAMAMIISLFPMGVLAEIGDGYGQCPHHTEHTEECGFNGGGTCTYICDICLAEVEELVAGLPALEELKKMTQDEKYEVMDLVDAIDRAKLNLSDAARELIDWTNYDAACVVLFMPEGFFGATISKGYLRSDYTPIPHFSFLDEHGEKAQILYSDLQTMSELLSVDENGKSEVFYLPEGTYTIEEIVDGEWDVSMEVDGVEADGLTFTAAAGEIIGISVQNGMDSQKQFYVFNSDGTFYGECDSFDDAFAELKNIYGGKLQYSDNRSDITVDSGKFTLEGIYAGHNPAFKGSITASGSADITVLDGNHYGDITLKNGATLTVKGGKFYGDITVEKGANLIVNAGEFYGTVTAQNDANVTVASSARITDLKKDTGKNIVLGAQALSGYDSANGYDYIYYGKYNENPIKWRVLDKAYNYDKNDASKIGMLLLTKNTLDSLKFGTDSVWSTSAAKTWCADVFASSFGTVEQEYVLQTNSDDILNDDALFFLSYEDVFNDSYFPDSSTLYTLKDAVESSWLLRAPYDNESVYDVYFGAVQTVLSGILRGARPAFNLDTSKILFTSAAKDGKNTTSIGILSPNGANTTGEYKLTMLDTDRDFEVTETSAKGIKGGTITFNYENVETGLNEYISAMIVDKTDGEVLYYGQGEKTEASTNSDGTANGTVTFTLPNEIADGEYTLYVFNEQINGDYKTDYSSAFKTVTLSVLPKATFTKNPTAKIGLVFNNEDQRLIDIEGASSEGTVKYSLSENGTYSADIPTGKDADTYTVWYYAEGETDHSDSDKASVEATILPKNIENAKITLGDNLIYNGTEQTQTISKVEVDGLTLTEDTDYTVSGNTGTEAKSDYKLTITGKGNFTGTATERFSIAKAGSQTTTTYNTTVTYGDTLTLTATVTKSARALNKVDFYVVEDDDAELLGTADVTYEDGTHGTATLEVDTKNKELILGDNKITAEYGGSVNLNGSKDDTITVTLKQKEVGFTWNNYDNLVYNGEPKNVTATTNDFVNGDDVSLRIADGDKTDAGDYKAKATLTGKDASYYKFKTSAEQPYKISPKKITKPIEDNTNFEYNGNEQTYTVANNTAYGVSGNTRTDAGSQTVKVRLNDKNNYTWDDESTEDVTFTFTINPKSVTATISDIADHTYTGSAITPQIAAYDGTTEIPESEYTVDYSNNIDAGTATVTLTNKTGGNYVVSGSKDFTIAKKSIENAVLALDGELTYNGNEQTQGVTLTLDGFTNVTFDISGNKQTNVKTDGDYTLSVTGTSNFEGTKPLDWNIKPYTPTENAVTTASVRRGATLAEAVVAEGEILGLNDTVLEGTFAWVDDTTEAVSTDCTKRMTFTPTDTNYAQIPVGVAVSTYSSGGSIGTARYTVKFNTDGGNTITSQTVTNNGKATEPTNPTKEGYIFEGWYTDGKFTTEYDFDTKVTKNITLYAKWFEDEIQEPSDDKKDDEQKPNDNNTDDEQKPSESEWKNPFTDVTSVDWFFDNVRYANENGLMSGVTNTEFAPNLTLTRGMLVTILYRLSGEPAVNKSIPFADVTADSYYADAVIWAEQNDIASGIGETEFAPDENITREQIAVILYRYARYKGYDVSVGEDTNILSYADFDEISEYAIEAVQYAVGSGLMKGKTESTLNPKDNATRAEIAAILNRFIENNK